MPTGMCMSKGRDFDRAIDVIMVLKRFGYNATVKATRMDG